MIKRIALPGVIERGRDTAITLDIYNDAGAQQTASAASLVLYDGTEEVVASTAATSLGPPASYTVTAATTSSRSLSGDWLAVWTMTIGGTEYVFDQPLQLVIRKFRAVITDDDLFTRHSDLDALRDTVNMATYEPKRTGAFERIQRKLMGMGNRPAMIMDNWAFADLHTYETLADIFNDFASSLSDTKYSELATDYRNMAKAEWESLNFRYDEDEDGRIGEDEQRAASPVVWLSRPTGWGYY